MLKTMATLLASGNASRNGKVVRSNLDPWLLRVLIGKNELEPGCGLFLEQPASGNTKMMEEFTIRLQWFDDICVGLTASFLGFIFHLFAAKIEFPLSHLYRPGGLIFRKGTVDKVLAIHYGSAACGKAPIIEV
jgi:hypothetical protein